MRWFFFSLILFIAALLDGGNLLNMIALGSGHIRPVILITVLVFSSLHTRRQDAVICAFAAGFAADLAAAAMGPHMVVYGIAGLALNSVSQTVSMKRIIHQSIVIFTVYLLTQFPVLWLEAYKTEQLRPHWFSNTLFTAVYTALLAPAIWLVLGRIWKRIYPSIERRSRLR